MAGASGDLYTAKPMVKGSGATEPSAGALVRSSRQEIAWVRDERLPHLEYREPSTALALGAISGGGGYLYTGDRAKGVGGFVAMLGALIVTPIMPFGLGLLPLAVVVGWGALGAYGQATALNRFLYNRTLSNAEQSGQPMSQQLLNSMPKAARQQPVASLPEPIHATPPDAPVELIERLRKLASIRASGVIDDAEHRARKIDILEEAATGLDASATESLLFALLPLLDAGTLTEEDMKFVKDLGS